MEDLFGWMILGLPAFILAGSIHEFMHAWTAVKLGDNTAFLYGRLTLNPLKHIDPYGLFLMIFARFGWMKPVPINENNFQNPVRDTALVSIAGPISNLIMAILSSLFLRVLFSIDTSSIATSFLSEFFITFTWINLALLLFIPKNLRHKWESLENYSHYILLALFLPFSPLATFTSALLSDGVQLLLLLLLS